MSSANKETDDHPVKQSIRNYNTVVGIVRHNTSKKQPPMIDLHHVTLHASHTHIDVTKHSISAILNRAVENGDLVRHRGWYAIREVDSLERVLNEVATKHIPRDDTLVRKCIQAIQELEDNE